MMREGEEGVQFFPQVFKSVHLLHQLTVQPDGFKEWLLQIFCLADVLSSTAWTRLLTDSELVSVRSASRGMSSV